jgi:hypothetical protein
MHRWRVGERGQGIVEFAVIFPIFVMLIFVMIDGGLLMGNFGRVNHGVDEGARYAATGASTDEIIERVSDQSGGLIDETTTRQCPAASQEEICVEYYPGPNGERIGEVGSRVKVSAHYHYYLITPIGTMAGGMATDHFSMDPCAIATLERPAQLDANDETSGGEPAC